jgi:transcription initiation factor TFIIB
MSEVATVSRIGEKRILRCLRYVSSELEISVEPVDPTQFVSQFVSDLKMGEDVQRLATSLIEQGRESREDGLSGRNPVSVAAGAIYLAGCTVGEDVKRTQAEISATVDVSIPAIRDAYRVLESECDVVDLWETIWNPME